MTIKDGTQYLIHENRKYPIITAGYRWIMYKWSFVIPGDINPIYSGSKIVFLETEMAVTWTERRDKTGIAGSHKRETFIEAWIL